MNWRIDVYFDRHDAWIGAYWTHRADGSFMRLTIYICPLPFLVIRLMRLRR